MPQVDSVWWWCHRQITDSAHALPKDPPPPKGAIDRRLHSFLLTFYDTSDSDRGIASLWAGLVQLSQVMNAPCVVPDPSPRIRDTRRREPGSSEVRLSPYILPRDTPRDGVSAAAAGFPAARRRPWRNVSMNDSRAIYPPQDSRDPIIRLKITQDKPYGPRPQFYISLLSEQEQHPHRQLEK